MKHLTWLQFKVISETLRFHIPIGILTRNVDKEYKVPGTELVLPKSTMVWINAVSISFDPEYYSNPNEFYPDHFSKEAKEQRNPFVSHQAV